MKAWIYIYPVVLAVGMVTALAQEAKTNTQTSATTSTLITNVVTGSPPMAATSAPAPAVAKEGKPPAVAPQKSPKAAVPSSMTATSAPALAVAKEVKPPAAAETSAVPAQTEITAEPLTSTNAAASPPENSGIGRKRILAGGAAILVVVLAILMWWRSHGAPHGSLITSAMNEDQKAHEDKNAPPPMA
jgi:hypothetical protein